MSSNSTLIAGSPSLNYQHCGYFPLPPAFVFDISELLRKRFSGFDKYSIQLRLRSLLSPSVKRYCQASCFEHRPRPPRPGSFSSGFALLSSIPLLQVSVVSHPVSLGTFSALLLSTSSKSILVFLSARCYPALTRTTGHKAA